MLTLKHCRIETVRDGFLLVDDVSLTLNPGDKVAVIGHEGTGKSTLLKAVVDPALIPYATLSGTIIKHGRIGYLEQDIATRWRGVDATSFFVCDHPGKAPTIDAYEQLKHLPKALADVGLSETSYDDKKTMEMFSGGEIVKLGLAKLLMRDVDMLVLDEPTNDLDFDTIMFLEAFMEQETRPMLFVSHDERLLENVANGIVHIQRIKKQTDAMTFVEKMGYRAYREHRLKQFEHQHRTALDQRKEHAKRIARWRQIYQRVEHQQNQAVRDPERARLLKKKIKSLRAQKGRFDKDEAAFTPVPEAEERIQLMFETGVTLPQGKRVIDIHMPTLCVGERVLARDLELTVIGREKVAITGKNGCGKTTLLRHLNRVLGARTDMVLGFMPQDHDEALAEKTPLGFLDADDDRHVEADVRKRLGALGFEREDMVRPASRLSGGQKIKLFLLKMVMSRANVLLLDEPTRNLSPLSAPEVHRMMQAFQGAIVCVTHDRAFIESVFDTLYRLDENGLTAL